MPNTENLLKATDFLGRRRLVRTAVLGGTAILGGTALGAYKLLKRRGRLKKAKWLADQISSAVSKAIPEHEAKLKNKDLAKIFYNNNKREAKRIYKQQSGKARNFYDENMAQRKANKLRRLTQQRFENRIEFAKKKIKNLFGKKQTNFEKMKSFYRRNKRPIQGAGIASGATLGSAAAYLASQKRKERR